MSKRIAIKDLHSDAISVTPRHVDWSEGGESMYEFWEAITCDECGRPTLNGEECEHCKHDNGYGEGPMMNYYYALPNLAHEPADAALLIAHLPLCIVHLENDTDEQGGYGLALTGGGMDLSWEICEGYVRLGYLPPIHFAGLPHMAQRTLTAHRLVLAAMRKSLTITKVRAMYSLQDLRRTGQWLKEHNRQHGTPA